MTTYRKAFEVMKDAIDDPNNKEKLMAAKRHPRLKDTLKGFTKEDMKALSKIAKTSHRRFKCNDA